MGWDVLCAIAWHVPQLLVSNSVPSGHHSLTVNGLAFQLINQVYTIFVCGFILFRTDFAL